MKKSVKRSAKKSKKTPSSRTPKKSVRPTEEIAHPPGFPYEEWRSGILRSMADGAVAINAQGEIAFVNQSVETLCGLTEKEVLGKKFENVLKIKKENSPEWIPSPVPQILALKTKLTLGGLALIGASGEEVPIEDSWTPILSNEGQGVGVVFIFKDGREKRLADEKRKALEAQILHVQKLESIGVLAGGIAHDFNNLLAIILGNASLAMSEELPLAKMREKIGVIELTALRASDLVKQILTYSGKSHTVMAEVNLSKVVAEMGALLQTSVSKKVAVTYHVAAQLPSLLADVAQVRQIAMNFIINASEAMGDQKGSITVSTGLMDADAAYLEKTLLGHDLKPGRYVYLEVKDTGCGMDAATKAKIFDPFFTTKFTGRGLGLAVVMGIVKAHGGAISVESSPGQGTTFRVLFSPLEKAQPKVESKKDTPSTSPTQSRGDTILVVDDEGTILSIVREMLEQGGYHVLTAQSGTEGIATVRQEGDKIAVVLLDLSMPDMDGTETLTEMRKFRPDMKVVMSSGFHEQDIISRLTDYSVKHFLQKPYRPTELLEKMHQVLEAPV